MLLEVSRCLWRLLTLLSQTLLRLTQTFSSLQSFSSIHQFGHSAQASQNYPSFSVFHHSPSAFVHSECKSNHDSSFFSIKLLSRTIEYSSHPSVRTLLKFFALVLQLASSYQSLEGLPSRLYRQWASAWSYHQATYHTLSWVTNWSQVASTSNPHRISHRSHKGQNSTGYTVYRFELWLKLSHKLL